MPPPPKKGKSVYVEVTHVIENKLMRFHATPATTRIDISKHPDLLQ